MNVLSIDLESWLHKYFLEYESHRKKEKDNRYVYDATLDTLKILERYKVKTSFYIVSEVFKWYPELIYKIKDMGHEIGFQTHTHPLLLRTKDIQQQLKLGKKFIEEFTPQGFRAPQGFMRKEYLPILKDWGFTYDSSIYSEFKIFEPIEGLLEVPVSTYPIFGATNSISYPRELTLRLFMKEIPFGSGYFIGILGKNVQWFINRLNRKNIPTSMIIHTWQIRDIPNKKEVNKKVNNNILTALKMIPYEINRRNDFEILLQDNDFMPMIKLINKYKYNVKASE